MNILSACAGLCASASGAIPNLNAAFSVAGANPATATRAPGLMNEPT